MNREIIEIRNFISELNLKNQSLEWFSTWIPSKNRFNSAFFLELQKKKIPSKNSFLKGVVGLYLKSLYSRFKLNNPLREFKNDVYLIKTFSYEKSFEENEFKDPFFPSLSKHLKEKKIIPVEIYDPIGGFKEAIIKNKKYLNQKQFIYPLHYFLRTSDFFWVFIKLIACSNMNVKGSTHYKNNDFKNLIKDHFIKDLFSFDGVWSLLHYKAALRITRQFQPKACVITCENNPWEKLFTFGIKKNDPSCEVIGYQHTVVPEASINMFHTKEETKAFVGSFLPDRILTVGSIPKKILETYSEYSSDKIQTACALRFQYLEKLTPVSKNKNERELLVGLEGVPEAIDILRRVVEELTTLERWTVKVRAHPALGPEQLKKLYFDKYLEPLPTDLIFSSLSLEEDLRSATVLLYWGSTVSLEAIKFGTPVIYCDLGTDFNYDPLFLLNSFKSVFKKGDSLVQILDQIVLQNEAERAQSLNLALQFLDDYFYRVIPERMDKFLPFR